MSIPESGPGIFLAFIVALLIFVAIWWSIGMVTTIIVDFITKLPAWWRGEAGIYIDLSEESRKNVAWVGPFLPIIIVVFGIVGGIRALWLWAKLPTSVPSIPHMIHIKARKIKQKPYVPTYKIDESPNNGKIPS